MTSGQAYTTRNKILSKLMWLDILGGGCIHCGYGKDNKGNLAAIDFHHKDPATKTQIPSKILQLSDQTEMSLCIPVCKTCHKMIEHNQTPYERGQPGINRKVALEKQGNKCVDCGISLREIIFEFHHLDSSTKTKSPTKLLSVYHRDPLAKGEIDEECVPLCCTCHSVRHNPKFNLDIVFDYLEELRILSRKISKKPSKEELLEVISRRETMVSVAKYFDVAETTIPRWMKKYNIKNPFCRNKSALLIDVSKEEISLALGMFSTRKEAANYLNISVSTLINRAERFGIKDPFIQIKFNL